MVIWRMSRMDIIFFINIKLFKLSLHRTFWFYFIIHKYEILPVYP